MWRLVGEVLRVLVQTAVGLFKEGFLLATKHQLMAVWRLVIVQVVAV